MNTSEDFMRTEHGVCRGGTELAPMSTTTSFEVAAKYAKSSECLIMKVVLENIMQYGADIQWLSAFPEEAEVIYPPLTYLQPTGRTQRLELDGSEFTIVEVRPTLP